MEQGVTDEIRFTQKKVDESWKDQVGKEKATAQPAAAPSSKPAAKNIQTSRPFLNLLSSLGYQAMMHLGELHQQGGPLEADLPAAKEIIDLLLSVKEKTAGNLSAEESQILETLLPELQMKFSEKS